MSETCSTDTVLMSINETHFALVGSSWRLFAQSPRSRAVIKRSFLPRNREKRIQAVINRTFLPPRHSAQLGVSEIRGGGSARAQSPQSTAVVDCGHGGEPDSLRKLCAAVEGDAPHAAEVLFLFAAEQGKLGHLLDVCGGTWMDPLYLEAHDRLKSLGSVGAFLAHEDTPDRFKKVGLAYEAKATTRTEANRRVIGLTRAKTLAALELAGVTAYRLCADLGLNQGNVYAYLGKGT